MKPWRLISSRELVSDKWLKLRADTCRGPNDIEISPYYVIEEDDWVQVFASDSNGDVLIVRQYRHAAGGFCLELPGGVVDRGEQPLIAAKRELLEETGFSATEWRAVGQFFANPARQTNRVHVFQATGLTGGQDRNLDATEEIEFAFMAPPVVEENIAQGEFSQGLHIASYFMCRSLSD